MQTLSKNNTAMPVLWALSLSHFLNDLLQAVVSAAYPIIKDDLTLTFTEIGIITLIYQLAASVFQPVVGLAFDRRPFSQSLPLGMCFTLAGIVTLAFSNTLLLTCASVFLVGVGSSILHPEASRITSLASGGRRGLAQSVFQVGGNLGGSLGPLLVAVVVAPYGRKHIVLFAILAIIALFAHRPICKWYKRYLQQAKREHKPQASAKPRPLTPALTLATIGILTILIFSKYIYMASLTNYYTFYLIEHFNASIPFSQVCLFVFLFATAAGTLVGGPIGDRIGRKYVIWISILGTAPFSLLMPHASLGWTIALSFMAGFLLSSAFPAILLYAQELLPGNLGLISGLFFGFSFGVAGIAAATLGNYIDIFGIESVYAFCAYTPLFGLVAAFLPNLKKKQ